MRFRTSETLHTDSPKKVLQALVRCLRAVAIDLNRDGELITLYGFGPSPITMNREDTTTLHVHAEDGLTIVTADVEFQPSPLLGDLPQETVVRSKLDRVFELIKAQLDIDKTEYSYATLAAPSTENLTASENEARIKQRTSAFEDDIFSSASPEEGGPSYEPEAPFFAPIDRSERDQRNIDRSTIDEPKIDEPKIDQPKIEEPSSDEWEIQPERRPSLYLQRGPLAMTFVLAVLMLTAGASWFWLRHQAAPLVSVPAAAESGVVTAAEPLQRDEKDDEKADPQIVTLAADASDPVTLLRHWADAMRSRDALAQASFYPETADRYFRQTNVSRASIEKEKRADIQNRKGLWTVKLEKVVVESQAESKVTVRLVKHYIAQPASSQISERFVRSRLELKRGEGGWKITSEQDLP